MILSITGVVGVCIVAWIPKEFELVRAIGLAFGMFASGMLASQHTNIWEAPND